jgi:hypothetical protein
VWLNTSGTPDHQIQKSVEEAGFLKRRYQQEDPKTIRLLLSGFTWTMAPLTKV